MRGFDKTNFRHKAKIFGKGPLTDIFSDDRCESKAKREKGDFFLQNGSKT